MKPRETFNKRLKPFGDLIYEAHQKIRDLLLTKSDDELRQLIEDTKKVTQTNCWWAIYNASGIVEFEAGVIIHKRKEVERR